MGTHVLRHVLRRVLCHVLHVFVLHMSPKGSVGGGMRVLGAGSVALIAYAFKQELLTRSNIPNESGPVG